MKGFNQKLGLTRSFKPILQPVAINVATLEEITSAFATEDHFDCYALFEYLISRELSSIGRDSPRIAIYESLSRFHKQSLLVDHFETQMKTLRLSTIFDVIEFGKCRADPVFMI